ncbi:MAG TPA: RNA polymerase sigma factor [bacterium]|nr:RNA polymerase sigma factor [bacterium]
MSANHEKFLVQKAVSGDVSAFEQLVIKDEKKIFSFALSISGGNRAAAEDVYQEALIKAFLNIDKFSFKSSFSTWLWKIIRNAYFDHLKANRKCGDVSIEDLEGFEPSFDEPSELELIRNDRAAMLRKLISALPVSYSEVITLVDLQELGTDEVAALLDIDKNLLKVRLHRARAKLEELIEKNMDFFK